VIKFLKAEKLNVNCKQSAA